MPEAISLNRRGMTLLELMISMAILSVIMVTVMAFASSISSSAEVEQQSLTLVESASLALDNLADSLQAGYIPDNWAISIYGDDNFRFLVPVDHDDDGDVLDFSGDSPVVEWGAVRDDYFPGDFLDKSHETSSSTQSFYTTIRYVKTGTFTEGDRGIDLNRDGDTVDTFDVGHLEKVYSAGADATRGIDVPERVMILTPDYVVRLDNTDGADWPDMDGDGDADPMFEQNGTRIRVTLYLSNTESKLPLFENVSTTIEMRNQQN
ncbi:MAG: type II secretion system protein [Planctomycetes bacterium]|nr:type II secretion system protein [Planctomycetota bacterium]